MIQWETNPELDTTERVLKKHRLLEGPLENPTWSIKSRTRFEDLLFGFFAAWVFKVIGKTQYQVTFVPIGASHTLMVVRKDGYPSIFPGGGDNLYYDTFLEKGSKSPHALTRLQAKLLYNASLCGNPDLAIRDYFESLTNVSDFRRKVIEDTLRLPEVYGRMFGGHPALLSIPPPVFSHFLTSEEPGTGAIMRTLEELLCINLGVETRAKLFTSHIVQKFPFEFNEADVLLYFPSEDSVSRRMWKKGSSSVALKDDVKEDLLFILENSSGLLEGEDGTSASCQQEDNTDHTRERAGRLYPKLTNLLAFRNVGFKRVRLHVCSLVNVPIANQPLQNIFDNDPSISVFRLPDSFAASIAEGTWTFAKIRRACNQYVSEALGSIRQLLDDK